MRKGPKTHYFNQTLVLKIKEKYGTFARRKNSPLSQTTFTFDIIYKQRLLVRKHRLTIILMEQVQWYEDFLRILVTYNFTAKVHTKTDSFAINSDELLYFYGDPDHEYRTLALWAL